MAVLAAAFAGLAAVSGVLAATTDTGSVKVGQNVFVNPDGPIDANNSPTVARNPKNPRNVVVAHRVDLPGFSASLQVSYDGGRAWQTTALPLPAGKDRPFAADVAYAPDGTLYVSYVNLQGSGNRPDNLWVSRSDDGGKSLSDPVLVAGPAPPLQFQARMVVDTQSVLHITYLRVSDVAPYAIVGYPSPIVASHSSDGGKTFSEGVEVDSDVLLTKRFLVFLPEFPSLAAGPGRSLYVTWADGRNGDLDVFIRRSGDGGATWGAPVRVNTNRVDDDTDQYMPRASVAPNGRVDVLFLDRRRDPSNVLTDAYLGLSEDNGATFDNVRVSSNSFDSRVGFSANPKVEADFGSRSGVTSLDDEVLAAWTDTRLGSEDTARQDIAAARITISEKKAPAFARGPVVVGLALAAAVCLLGWWVSGRERMAPSAAPAARGDGDGDDDPDARSKDS